MGEVKLKLFKTKLLNVWEANLPVNSKDRLGVVLGYMLSAYYKEYSEYKQFGIQFNSERQCMKSIEFIRNSPIVLEDPIRKKEYSNKLVREVFKFPNNMELIVGVL